MTVAENVERARMAHFRALDHEQQAQAVRRLSNIGHSKQTIARATGLSVEMIARILSAQGVAA